MPIYEYTCKRCGHAFEHFARTLNAVAETCPKCGAGRPEKQISTFTAAAAKPSGPCAAGDCPTASSCRSAGCRSGQCPLD